MASLRRIVPALTLAVSAAISTGAQPLFAQQSAADEPRFDVASVKINKGAPGPPLIDGRAFRQSGRVTVTNMSLLAMIQVLYRGQDPAMLIEGGPDWLQADRFDIVATGDPGTDAGVPPGQRLPRMNRMLRALLEDRFQLRTHVERRQMQIYALVPANTKHPAAKLHPSATTDCAAAQTDPERRCGMRRIGPMGIAAVGVTLDQFALTLSALGKYVGLDRPVENRTGIEGRFDIDLMNDAVGARTAPEQGARLMTLLREQLGLVLRSVPGTRDVLVIDHAEHPTPN
jgi:uncharacterized protein (TIGR03435 family)